MRRHKEQVEALLAAHLTELDGLPAAGSPTWPSICRSCSEGAMSRAGLEGDSRRLHRVRELALS